MIRYFCETCNIEGDLSTCSICGERTQIKSKLYWCKECNIPIYDEYCSLCGNKGKESTTDIRPVFPEERLLRIENRRAFLDRAVAAGRHHVGNA